MRMSVKPFHVLMTADALGGVWQYTLDLAGGLNRRGVTVTIALMGPAPAPEHIARAEVACGGRILGTGLPLDWTAEAASAVQDASVALARLARECGADLVHLHSPALALAVFDMPVVAVCHSCVATWWAALSSEPLPSSLAWRCDLAAQGCRRAGRLLAPTQAFAAATEAAYGLTRRPLVVRNGRRLGGELCAPRPAPHAFAAGRLWDRAKNVAALDRMAARLPLPVLAAGPLEGPNGDRVQPQHLRLLGRLDDAQIAAELACRPIFVSLARYEPFGLTVLEAANAGCALVLSDIPSFRELWEGAALFVPAEDDAAAARAVESLAADPARRSHLGAGARARAEDYDVDTMVDSVLGVFRSMLAEIPIGRLAEAAA